MVVSDTDKKLAALVKKLLRADTNWLACWCIGNILSTGVVCLAYALSVGDNRLDEALVNLDYQVPKNTIVQFALPVQCGDIGSVTAEIYQPVGAFALSGNGVRQATLLPQPANENLATLGASNHGLDFGWQARLVAGELVRIENEQAFINLRLQFRVSVSEL